MPRRPSPPSYVSQVPDNVRMRIGPPRAPRGAPPEIVEQHLEAWTDPASGRKLLVQVETEGAYWIVDPDLGEVRIPGPAGQIEAWPAPGVRPARFMETLFYRWMRPVYGVWGWRVLPAAAVVRSAAGSAIAFAGPVGSGKSTLACAVGAQPGWRQLTDDALALTDPGNRLHLLPIPNRVRLAPPALERLCVDPDAPVELEWPATPPKLEALYVLTTSGQLGSKAEITPMRLLDAWRDLLAPASALTLPAPELRTELSTAVRELVAGVRIFRLAYAKNIEHLSTLTRGVSLHALKVIGQAESLRQSSGVQSLPIHTRLRSVPESPA